MPPAADRPPGPRLALVVATNTYTDPGLRQLRAPARDADDLTQVLADPDIGGFTVTTVIDQPAYQIRLAVEDFLDGRGTQDLLLVYLSCHGLLDARRRLYFAATDTRKDRLGSTGVESAWVLDQLEHCRARRQILIIDSCFSGAFTHGAKGEADLDLRDRFLGQGRGRIVLTASNATEYSFEGDPTDAAIPAGSVFTAALVQGLRTGAADTDRDGHVSVDEAYAYVFDQVQAAGAAQTPQRWLYGAEGHILLARNPAGPTITPAPLPESLRAGLDSPHPSIRIGAVTELGEWLTGGDPARAATARRHLQEVADTDIPRVAQTARTLIGTTTAAGPPTPDRQAWEEADRKAREEAEQRARELADHYALACAAADAHDWDQAFTAFTMIADIDPGYRDVAARLGESSRRRDIAALQEQLRAMSAAGEFQAVADIADRLAGLDPAAADPDGVATQARQQIQQHTAQMSSAQSVQDAIPVRDTEPGQHSRPLSHTAAARVPRLAHTLTDNGWFNAVYSVAFSPDGRLLASGSGGDVQLWDPATGEHQRTLRAHSGSARAVAFSPDGRLLASGGSDSMVRLWDPATGEHQRTLDIFWQLEVRSVAFSPDGRLLASSSGGDTVQLWDPATGEHQRRVRHTETTAFGAAVVVAFSPDGRLLGSGSNDKTVRLWDPATGEHQRTLTGHTDDVSAVAFSPDGRLLASGSIDKTVRLWDPATGEHQRTLTGHTKRVESVAFSPDGRLLASGSYDKTVRLWDPAAGEHQRTLTGHTKRVESVAFSPDGRLLASGSGDKTVRLWAFPADR